jgi:hypothetical protein
MPDNPQHLRSWGQPARFLIRDPFFGAFPKEFAGGMVAPGYNRRCPVQSVCRLLSLSLEVVVKTAVRTVVALSLVVLLAAFARAEDKKAGKKKPKKEPAPAISFPKKIKLDEKQQAALTALNAEYGPQLKALNMRENKILTPERRKAGNQAAKAAKAEGKKVGPAVEAAWKLSAEEKTQLKEIRTERGKLNKEINKKKMALLTAEQKEQLKAKQKKKEK